ADNWTNERHLLLAGADPLRFAEFMQAGDRKLRSNEPEDHSGHRKKAGKRDFDCALEKEEANCDGGGEAEDRAYPGLQTRAGELDGAENQSEFHPFAQNHEKHEKKDAPARGGAGAFGINVNLVLDFLTEVARNSVHPKDHRNDKDSCYKKKESFEAVFVDVPTLE